ncbi:MAG: hypothetical protein NZ518_04160, partial [Dehalococcoidia bacterium]|nr:hypothetical protein [Dehalococcoidia bacterium]
MIVGVAVTVGVGDGVVGATPPVGVVVTTRGGVAAIVLVGDAAVVAVGVAVAVGGGAVAVAVAVGNGSMLAGPPWRAHADSAFRPACNVPSWQAKRLWPAGTLGRNSGRVGV